MKGILPALLVLALAGAGRAEIVRCEDAAGRLRFTDDPRRCVASEPVAPDPGRLQRVPTPERAPAGQAGGAKPGAATLSDHLPAAPLGWEATHEPVDVEADPALRAGGLLASVARHYGRSEGLVSHLCTVEIWSFASSREARIAQAALGGSGDWTRVVGPLLVMARSVRMERGVGASRALARDCRALAASVDGAASRP